MRDGRRQVTYNGWPLYYYAHEEAGEVKVRIRRTAPDRAPIWS
jgi:hypothetical protein